MSVSMSRQHFEMIADVIRNVKETTQTCAVPYDASSALGLLTLAMGDALAKTNPNFSYSRFLDACSYEREE